MQTIRHPQTDASERRLPPPSPADQGRGRKALRRARWFVALGFTLLAASAIGTGVVLRSHAQNGKATDTSSVPSEVAVGYAFGHVDVEERVIELYPRLPEGVPNVVTEVLVKENDFVAKNKPLLRLDPRPARWTVQKAETNLKDAELQLKQAKAGIPYHESMIETKRKAVEAAKEELKKARLQRTDVRRRRS